MYGIAIPCFIHAYIRLFRYVLFVFILAGCTTSSSDQSGKSFVSDVASYEQSASVTSAGAYAVEKASVPDSLTINEYMAWLYDQSGMTYTESGNQDLKVSLLYRPQVLEAAMAGETLSQQESKSGYLYFELSWLDKKISVNKASGDKERLAAGIRESLLAETGSGVVYNTIVEVFPPVLLNQPGKMLVLVPASSFRDWIELRFRGEKTGLEDAVLRLTGDDIKNLPNLKI